MARSLNTGITTVALLAVLGGLCIGACLAIVLGYFIAKSPVVNSLVSPLVVASQAIPIVAIAPLLAAERPAARIGVVECDFELLFVHSRFSSICPRVIQGVRQIRSKAENASGTGDQGAKAETRKC